MTQADLFAASPAPRVSLTDVDRLIAQLRDRGWVKREQIAWELGMPIRLIRALAEHSDGQVIGSNKGLALLSQVTVAEAERAARRLESQAKKMHARAVAIRRRMHRKAA